MRIGYFQYHPEFGAPKRNLEKVEDSLAGVEADIIVLPELAFTGYFFEDRDELRQLAEEVSDSPTVRGLSRLCRKKSFYLVAGFAERYQKRLYNAALVIGPRGLVHCYRKLHLFNTEKEYFDPGDTPLQTIEIRGAKIGVMICFDWVFPEVARSLALQGADLLCHPSNLVLTYCQKTMSTRSLENAVYSITANRIGKEARPRGELEFTGRSQIVGPRGEVIASSGFDDEAVVLKDIDLSAARNKFMTPKNNLFADRRPAFYNSLARSIGKLKPPLEIELDLRNHCIETAIKRCYNRLISGYFRNGGGDSESEEKLALLEKALRYYDFSALRNVRRELAGESNARITLTGTGDTPLGIAIDGSPVNTKHCLKKRKERG
jgi:predicted amidohydrolase